MRHLAGLLAAAGLLGIVPTYGAFTPEREASALQTPALSRDIVAETELYCLTLGIYFEGGSTDESEEGQRHITQVITQRAKANRAIWGGSSICGVVFHKRAGVCQFSFACLPAARRTPKFGPAWQASRAIAEDALAGRNETPDNQIRYYMNVAMTPLKNACRFKKEFVPFVKAGRHDFFREAASWERKELAQAEPEECRRYKEMLAAQKAKQKKKLAKLKAKKKKPTKMARLK